MTALLLVTTCWAQESSRFDQLAQHYVSNKNFMGSVLIARNNEILFNKGYGSANLEWDIPNTPTTEFRHGYSSGAAPGTG